MTITTFFAIIFSIFSGLVSAILVMSKKQEEVVPPVPTPEPVPEPEPITSSPPPHMETQPEKLYALAKSLIGTHLSLDNTVPWMVGCGEAVSDLLKRFGIAGIPHLGIAGTAQFLTFLKNSNYFEEIHEYEVGAIIVNATGTGNGKVRGHIGVCGKNQIMSNNSETGKWDTQWTYDRWNAYYHVYGGIPTRFFRLRG